MLKQACASWQRDGDTVETVALEYDELYQKSYNVDSMEESGCDDDVVAAANADIQDSEDFEYFYDWLIK